MTPPGPDLPGGPPAPPAPGPEEGAGFGLDALDGLLAQARGVQERLRGAQEALAEVVVEGSAGGGAVKVRANGALQFLGVDIDPGALDPADPGLVEDLVLAAVRDAVSRVNELNAQALGGLGGPGGALGGLLP